MQLTREMLRLIDGVGPDDIKKCPLPKISEEVGDRVVGDLPWELQKFFVFYLAAKHDLDRSHESLHMRLDKAKTKKEAKWIGKQLEISQLRFDHTERNFLDELYYIYPELIGERHIAIKAGWKVVVFKPATSRIVCYLTLVGAMLPRKRA